MYCYQLLNLEASMKFDIRLSPATGYYIRKLVCQPSGKVQDVAGSKTNVGTDVLSNLDEVLQTLYPSATDTCKAIQRLEDLVYLHKSLRSQTFLYEDYAHELTKLEQQIYRLLGFQKVEV